MMEFLATDLSLDQPNFGTVVDDFRDINVESADISYTKIHNINDKIARSYISKPLTALGERDPFLMQIGDTSAGLAYLYLNDRSAPPDKFLCEFLPIISSLSEGTTGIFSPTYGTLTNVRNCIVRVSSLCIEFIQKLNTRHAQHVLTLKPDTTFESSLHESRYGEPLWTLKMHVSGFDPVQVFVVTTDNTKLRKVSVDYLTKDSKFIMIVECADLMFLKERKTCHPTYIIRSILLFHRPSKIDVDTVNKALLKASKNPS